MAMAAPQQKPPTMAPKVQPAAEKLPASTSKPAHEQSAMKPTPTQLAPKSSIAKSELVPTPFHQDISLHGPITRDLECSCNYPVLDEVQWGVEEKNNKVLWFGQYWVKNMPADDPNSPFTGHAPITFDKKGGFTAEAGSKWEVASKTKTKGCSCGYGKAYDDAGVVRAEGLWDKGAFIFGNAFNAEGIRIYSGNYMNAKRHGRGEEFSGTSGEKVFEGTFYKGSRLHGTEYNAFNARK